MKKLIFITTLMLSFSAVAATTTHKEDQIPNKDQVVKGESAAQRRDSGNQPPGSRENLNNGPKTSDDNSCTDDRGNVYKSNDKGHRKCVDNANRIK